MALKPRIQFPGTIYYVSACGFGRRSLFHDEGHDERFTAGLEAEVLRSRRQAISYCWMPNDIHALIKTPDANLSNWMQHWLSGYANLFRKAKQQIEEQPATRKTYLKIKNRIMKNDRQC